MRIIRIIVLVAVSLFHWSAATVTDTNAVLTATTNQLTLGTTNTVTINAAAPSASRTVTIPDGGANANVVLTQGSQTIAGATTFQTAMEIDDTYYENLRVRLSTTTSVYGRFCRTSNVSPNFGLSYNWYRTPNGSPSTYVYDVSTLPQAHLLIDNNGNLAWRSQAAGSTANNLITATPWMYIDSSGNMGLGTSSPTEVLHVVGNVKTTGGVYLPTSGGTATLLNYYEEYQLQTTCSGPWASRNCYVDVTRIGRIVHLHLNTATSATSTASSSITFTTALPSRFYPPSSLDCQGTLIGGQTTSSPACCTVSSAGVINLYNDVSKNNFPISSTVGWGSQQHIATYHV